MNEVPSLCTRIPRGIRVTPTGSPSWTPVDMHLFAAPIGFAATGYAESRDTMVALLPHHGVDPSFGLGAETSHAPPYDRELADRVGRLGYHEGVRFDPQEFSNGMGVWIGWMNVPRHPRIGRSPDFALGLVIPNTVLPIHVEGAAEHDGTPFSSLGQFDVPPLEVSTHPRLAGMDGHSHFPVFFADNADFGPPGAPLSGNYVYRITMRDRFDSGWLVEACFAIGMGAGED